MDIMSKFEKGIITHTYQRIDPIYKVDFFLGYNDNGQMSLILTEEGKTERVSSSKLIEVQMKRREDKKIALSFDLLDKTYASMFTVFCKDMIVVCETVGKKSAISSALIRWKYWKELFGNKRSHLMDKQEIKGLIGELYWLQNHMIPNYGYRDAIKSWMGPLLGHKDFEVNGTWHEIKTINDGAVQVTISSLEQLDSELIGHLNIIRIDETSETNSEAVNVNEMVLKILDLIEDPESLDEFRIKLDNMGYVATPEYEQYCFVIKGTDSYTINEKFPRIVRNTVHNAIGKVQYTILLAGISDFKE